MGEQVKLATGLVTPALMAGINHCLRPKKHPRTQKSRKYQPK